MKKYYRTNDFNEECENCWCYNCRRNGEDCNKNKYTLEQLRKIKEILGE